MWILSITPWKNEIKSSLSNNPIAIINLISVLYKKKKEKEIDTMSSCSVLQDPKTMYSC